MGGYHKLRSRVNNKSRHHPQKALFLCLEYERCHPLWSIGTWKDHHCRNLSAIWLTEALYQISYFVKVKRCYSSVWQCKGTYSAIEEKIRSLGWVVLPHPPYLNRFSTNRFLFLSLEHFISDRTFINKIENSPWEKPRFF